MWKVYPNPIEQLALREAMLKAYNFLSGQYDHEEKERAGILLKIKAKTKLLYPDSHNKT